MLSLARQTARHRIAGLLAVGFAVLGGAALVTGTGVLAETGLVSHLPAGRLAGADVVVTPVQTVPVVEDMDVPLPERGTLPADLPGELAGVPGVTSAVGDVSFPAAVVGRDGPVSGSADAATAGHGWTSSGLAAGRTVDGAAPTGDDEVALDRSLAAAAGAGPGDDVQVVAAGRTATYRVSAVVGPAGTGVLFADPTARELAGRGTGPRAGTVDLVGLRVSPGATDQVADAVRAQLGDRAQVATGADRGDAALPAAAAAGSMLLLIAGSLGGTVLLVVGFIVAGALSVSIAGQRRDLALLRAVGATPRQIRGLAAGQATLVAAVALLPGIALGHLLAGQFRRLLVHIGLLPEGLPLHLSPLPALGAAVLLLAVVQVAARGAAWRTSRMPATAAVGESVTGARTPSRVRVYAGLALLAAALPVAVLPLLQRNALGAASTSLAGIVAAIGLTLAGPGLLPLLTGRLLRRLPGNATAPTWLAVANVHGYALRFAGAVSTLAMGVVFVLTYTFAQTTVIGATDDEVRAGTRADTAVTAAALGGVPADVLPALRAVPGVTAAEAVTGTSVVWTHRELGSDTTETEPALVLSPGAAGVVDLDVRAGRLSDLTGPTIAVGREVAEARSAEVGSTVRLRLGDGTPVRARVVAVYDRTLGFGSVALSPDLAAGHVPPLAQQVLVRTDGSARAQQGLAALAATRPGLAVGAADARDSGAGGVAPEVWVNLAAVSVLLGYLLLGIANQLVAATLARRGELATLRLTGSTPRQVRAMVRREAGLMTAAALAAGLALAVVPLALLGIGFLDRPWPAGPWWVLPATALGVAAVAYLTTELPTRRLLRAPLP